MKMRAAGAASMLQDLALYAELLIFLFGTFMYGFLTRELFQQRAILPGNRPIRLLALGLTLWYSGSLFDELASILLPGLLPGAGFWSDVGPFVDVARKHNVRLMGPNIYGFYYTHKNLCATFCTPYDEKGPVALSSQSGGVGMAIIGFSRSNKMGVSAIVGLGNKSDIDEDDLLTSLIRR